MVTAGHAWTEAGAFPVAEGVHRIPLPLPNDGLRAVNVYVLETADGLVAVDGGWALPGARALLARALATLGAGLGDLRRFLVTHVHRDHYTQAVAVRRETGARVGLGVGERPSLEVLRSADRSPQSEQVAALRASGAAGLADRLEVAISDSKVDLADWEPPDEWLTAGDYPLPGGRVLEAVETPGHTSGHLVFHDLAARLLFAGDHVLPTITPSIGFQAALAEQPLADFLRSLALVRTRPNALLLPAHGPVAVSVHARVDELIAHHGRRLDEAEAAAAGSGTAADVAAALRWTRRQLRWAELDDFNAMLAVLETGAHLDLLTAQGRLTVQVHAGVKQYG